MARLASPLLIYPIKGFPPVERKSVRTSPRGTIKGDREYALFDQNDAYVNGRSHPRIMELQADFDLEAGSMTVWERGSSRRTTLELFPGNSRLNRWFSDYFGEPVELVRAPTTNFTDGAGGLAYQKTAAPGPSLISEASLRTVASWFEELEYPSVIRRLRPNFVVEDTRPFWEDQLWTDPDHIVRFTVGSAVLGGVAPLPRCSVPTRDPETGETTSGFISTFIEKRKETTPEQTEEDLLTFGTYFKLGEDLQSRYEIPDYYFLGAVTQIPRESRGRTIEAGDPIEIRGREPMIKNL